MTTLTYTDKTQASRVAEEVAECGFIVTIQYDGGLYVLILEEVEQ